MADPSRGKSILDAYSDSPGDTDAAGATPPSRGASILDAYQTQDASAPPAAKSWQDQYFPAPTQAELGDIVPSADNPLSRIIGAGAEGFRTGPRIVDLPAIEQAERSGPVGYYINSPLMQGVNFPLRALNAAYKGGQAAIDVGLSPLNPLLGTNFSRDMAALPEAFPFGASFLRPPGRPPIPEAPPTPRFVQEFYGEGTPSNPLAAGPAAERPAFVPPGVNIPPRPVEPPAFVPPRTEEGVAGPTESSGGPQPPVPPVEAPPSPTDAPPARISPINTQAQAEAEADRILRHFAGDQPVVIKSDPLASGAQPTLSQSVEGGHGGLAGLERGIRDVPEQNQHFVARETANTTLRNKAVGDVIGDPRATDVIEAELNARTAPQEAAIFDPAKTIPVDPSDAIAMLDQIRSSGKGQRDAVANALDHLRGKLIDKDGNMQTDPAQLRGVDLAIKDMISPMAAGTKQDGRAAAHELMAVRDVLRDNIEQGAPGYKDFLAQQAAERSAIDGQRFLQARNITDRQGNVNLGTLDATIKAAERQQAMPGARLADGVTDAQLDTLRKLRADYQNDAKQRLGTSLGSPTVQKLGVSGSMGMMGHPLLAGTVGAGVGAAGAYLAGINPLIGVPLAGASYLMKQQSLKGQRMVMDALRDKLLNPEKARSAFTPP